MEIINFKELPPGGRVAATFDVYLGDKWGIAYPNLRIVVGKNGGRYIDRPSFVISENGDGSKVYGKYPAMKDEKWKDFKKTVEELLKPFLSDSISL